jgi:hypothetical protein
MGSKKKSSHKSKIHGRLCALPRTMISLHGHDNLTEFVLYTLCNDQCFDVKRAAYFVDSPDFNCLKGIAGFSHEDISTSNQNIWSDPAAFSGYIQQAAFNQKVRSFVHESLRRKGENDSQIMQMISQELALNSPLFCSWDMKHGNHGLFLYELLNSNEILEQDDLLNGLSLLSFCPIY